MTSYQLIGQGCSTSLKYSAPAALGLAISYAQQYQLQPTDARDYFSGA